MTIEIFCRIISASFLLFVFWSWYTVIREYKWIIEKPDRGYGGKFNGEKSGYILLKDGRKIPILGIVWISFLAFLINWICWFQM